MPLHDKYLLIWYKSFKALTMFLQPNFVLILVKMCLGGSNHIRLTRYAFSALETGSPSQVFHIVLMFRHIVHIDFFRK